MRSKYLIVFATAVLTAVFGFVFYNIYRGGEVSMKEGPFGVYTNHLGYAPASAKFCMMKGSADADFQVVDVESKRVVYKGIMKLSEGTDFGEYVVGDFNELKKTGTYQIQAADSVSYQFSISNEIYDSALLDVLGYFQKQRCGNSTTGWNGPCHLDDGKRMDNGEYLDVTGGWHDACDVRKWVGATIYGMVGLLNLWDIEQPAWDNGRILDELKWGNRYFLNMQDSPGYIMTYIAGDDGNYWSDSRNGTDDDRVIHTNPASSITQFMFIYSEAKLACMVSKTDPAYSKKCLDAALKCLEWTAGFDSNDAGFWNSAAYGAGAAACTELYSTTGDTKYRDSAVGYAQKLMALQAKIRIDPDVPVTGFFINSEKDTQPFRDASQAGWQLIGLCEVLESFPDDPGASAWRNSIDLYCSSYLKEMSNRTAFGIVPFGLYDSADPGGNRRIGKSYYWYRWFMDYKGEDWWVGINENLASAGVGLIKASKLLKRDNLGGLAQRQLDWILGVNPFNATTMTGSGYNDPQHYYGNIGKGPQTPPIKGGVRNGIGGTTNDEPYILAGDNWQTSEYWTPMVGMTAWLMAELQRENE